MPTANGACRWYICTCTYVCTFAPQHICMFIDMGAGATARKIYNTAHLPSLEQFLAVQLVNRIVRIAMIFEFLCKQSGGRKRKRKTKFTQLATTAKRSTQHPYHTCTNTRTYHKAVAIFDENLPRATVSFEEALQIAFPDAIRQAANIHS